jgi:G patch domain/KOW motif-containing protein
MSSEDTKKTSLSFGFAKSSSKKLSDSALRDSSTKEALEETDFVLEVNRSQIKGSKVLEIKKELVIPCTGNTYKLGGKKAAQDKSKALGQVKSDDEPSKELTEEELAAQALIEDSKQWQENHENEDKPNENLVIPSQTNEEIDDKAAFDADLDARPDISSQDDYESVPVDGFGMGMLRGMGFKADQGLIGGFKKAKVACIEPVMRPKGLGLGALRPKTKNEQVTDASGNKKNKEELLLQKGSLLQIEKGQFKGQYGEVDGIDGETARVIVRLSVEAKVVSVSENVIRLVDKDEYKKFKNVINKEMFDEYSQKQKEREKDWKLAKRPREEVKKEKYQKDVEPVKKSSKKSKSNWVRRRLRVRIIDPKNKYYKQKVIVNEVISPDRIECLTDSGRILDDIDPYDVETVVPKDDLGIVMIVRGSEHTGKIAQVLRKDSKRALAAVQLLPDKEEVIKVDFDDICELTGDISELF